MQRSIFIKRFRHRQKF